jgi:phytoene dehydrogenase-like protein
VESIDVVVVGSGAGDLAASAALATRGVDVCCFEAMPEPGGYLNPFRRGRYRFDAGLHYLGQLHEHGVFRALLERLGAWDLVSFLPIDPDGFLDFR